MFNEFHVFLNLFLFYFYLLLLDNGILPLSSEKHL